MTYQRVLTALAIGSAVAGIGFLALHPRGRKIRNAILDATLAGADKFIDYLRANEEEKNAAEAAK